MTPFFEFKPGSNVIRLLTTPYQYQCHSKLKLKGKADYGQRLKCPALMLDTLKCDLCEEDRSHPRWIIACLSRLDDSVYLIDIDWQFFSVLRDYARHQHWGDPTKYDLDITFDTGDNRPRAIPIPNMRLDFDKPKYPVDIEELNELSSPNIKDLEAILTKNYEEVKNVFIPTYDDY